MAKVTGRDVLIDLIDTVNQLKATQVLHTESLERIHVRLGLMAERTAETAARAEQMAADVALFARAQAQESDDLTKLKTEFVGTQQLSRQTQLGLGRLAQLLTISVDASDHRFSEIEDRLTRIEKKTG